MATETGTRSGMLDNWLATYRVLRDSGLLGARRTLASIRFMRRWGATPIAGFEGAAFLHPDRAAIHDEAGTLTFAELSRRTNAIARGLEAAGVRAGSGVGILCRNHRGFVEATLAAGKLGAHALFLNTGFAERQLREVLDREGVDAVVYDQEFAPLVEAGAGERQQIIAWPESAATHPTLDELAERHSSDELPGIDKPGRMVILTSGTTGTPKGAQRAAGAGVMSSLIGLLEMIPLRAGETTVIAAPTFHAWGLSHLMMGAGLSSTLVLRRRFDPEKTLAAIAETRAHALAVVPVMMQRILALDRSVIDRYDTSSLRVVAVSGSALTGELAHRWMDTFGDNIYNLYGSTEVAQASIATPTDLRAAPGTAGRPPRGSIVRILDENGKPVPQGQTGRIFVANAAQFEGYTGGGGKEVIDGLMSSGDVGHFDENGRLFIDGRDDEMIVSGGENVFPAEVESLLAEHDAVYEAAVIGVEDADFGQRLKAFVVLQPGGSLTADETRDYVKKHLARYKVPRDVVFLDELPRNPTGKVLKRELKAMDA